MNSGTMVKDDATDALDAVGAAVDAPHASAPPVRKAKPRIGRMERLMSWLSAKWPLWQRLSSMLFLPYAFRSGIRMKRVDDQTFTAVLPFKRFNKNWYNAMAGASLLAGSEFAAGMYIFGETGGGYSIVCKRLTYDFLRPCFGPALYRVKPNEQLKRMVEEGGEFNVELDIDVLQQIPGRRDRRVGRVRTIFYATPKSLMRVNRRKDRAPAGAPKDA